MNYLITQLYDYLVRSAANFPDKIALVYGSKNYTYSQLNAMTDNIAKHLKFRGLQRGDRVVSCIGNCVETVLVFWATLKAGGVISVINPELPIAKIAYIVKDSQCKFLILPPIIARELFSETYTNLNEIIAVELNHKLALLVNSIYKLTDFVDDSQAQLKLDRALDIDLASIIYTSGSTGEPKGVMLTHRNMITATESINAYLTNHKNDVILCALPMSFDYGLYQMIMAFSAGAKLVLERDFYLPLRFLKLIEDEKVTALPGVPSMFSILGENIGRFKYDLSSVRYVTNTGAAIYDHHINIIENLFPHANFFSMYGLTECKRCTYLPPEDIIKKPRSVGIPIPNTEMWIIDDLGNKVPANTIGQLVIRGATVMQGYWNSPTETANKLKPGVLPNEMVLHTGDYGYIDSDGYFYFHSRRDEMIKSHGEKVSPVEIEAIIYQIHGIKEAAVIAVPDKISGNKIIAYIVPFPHADITSQQILSYCKSHLEKSKIPKEIIFVKQLKKSMNGKINKLDLLQSAGK